MELLLNLLAVVKVKIQSHPRNDLIFRKCRLKYLQIKCHNVYN